MAFTLQLSDLSGVGTALDFLATAGDPHLHLTDGGLSIPAPKNQRVWGGKSIYSSGERLYEANYSNRTITIEFAIHGSTRDKIAEGWRDVVRACQDIQNYAMDFAGKHWELQYAADGAADTTYFDPLDAIADLPGDFLSAEKQHWQDSDDYYVLHECILTLTCKPFARGDVVEMENLILNPSFEHWNSGTVDSQPDSWTDYETATGTNNRESTSIEHGLYSLKIDVTNSTAANEYKGVTQNITTTDGFLEAGQSYTLIAWVKNAAITNGVVRVEAYGTNTGSQYALNSGGANASFTRYAKNFTFHASDTTLTIRAYVNSSAASCSGTAYVDKMIVLKGNFETDTTLAYMTSSKIVNHFDIDAGDVNFCDVADVPGDMEAKTRMLLKTPSDSGTNQIKTFRIGRRWFRTIFELSNYGDRGEVSDANCSGGLKTQAEWLSNDWNDIDYYEITNNILSNSGKFRILARTYDSGSADDLKLRAVHFAGGRGFQDTIEDSRSTPSVAKWTLMDLGIADWRIHGGYRPSESLGVAIQGKRPTGTEACHLDYVLLMPLDGGYVTVRARNALADGDDIVLDNISESFLATALRIAYDRKLPSPGVEFGPAYTFENDLYAGKNESPSTDARVYKWDGDSWTDFSGDLGGVYALGVTALGDYDGNLYAGTWNTGRIYVYSGGSWSQSYDSGSNGIWGFHVYKGKLYCGSDNAVNKIYSYDGTTWAEAYTTTGQGLIQCSEVYKGNLYFGSDGLTSNSNVYKYDGSSWSVAWDTGATWGVKFLKAAHGYLYCGIEATVTNGGGIYRTTDGTSWTRVWSGQGANVVLFAYTAAELNDRLYVGTWWASFYYLMYSDNGTDWTTFSIGGYTAPSPDSLVTYNDMIAHSHQDATDSCFLYTPIDLQTGAPDVVGRPLYLSPDIDQRLTFSFDRDDDENIISDYIHFRLHYEPQFLHVRVD